MASALAPGMRRVVATAAIVALWGASSIPWGMPPWQLVPFIAPGGLLGLGMGFVAHAEAREKWTWPRARAWALMGGFALAPLLALFVGVEGNLHPERLLSGFVRAAWTAFALGAILAVTGALRASNIRATTEASTPASPATRPAEQENRAVRISEA